MKLKNIAEQTIVITGATSGIGLVTARMAAEKGAKVVLTGRNEEALQKLTDEINGKGGRAAYQAADVGDEAQVRRVAEKAQEEFGGFDTWVNNSAVSVFGRILDVPIEDMRRVIETNFWGVVYGSRIAAEHLRGKGGAIINVGSELSDRAVPLQGIYVSSKHAVKGFTDSLRMELEGDNLPVSVTLIKPTAIGTPYNENARNYLPYESKGPQPVFAPDLVGEAILYAAENPVRDFFVGESAKLHSLMETFVPRLTDKFMAKQIDQMQNAGTPKPADRPDGLYETNSKLEERSPKIEFMFERSVYQKAKMNPFVVGAVAVGGSIALAALLGSKKKSNGDGKSANGNRRLNGAQIREHMEVVGSDDAHVGTVDRVDGDKIKLTKNDPTAGGKHHEIPLASVEKIEGGKVRLNQNARQARQQWQAA